MEPSFYAKEIRHQLGLNGPIDVYEVCNQLKVDIFEESLDIDGALLRKNGKARIIINSDIKYVSRKSFTVAHEIGHLSIPNHKDQNFYCTPLDIISFHSDRKMEVEANQFAAELLLPTIELQKELYMHPNFLFFNKIAEKYGASLTATIIKIIQLTDERIAIILSKDGTILWSSKSKSFPYKIKNGALDVNTFAYDFFKSQSLQEQAETVMASSWCLNVGKDIFITEESIVFDRLGIVLTLLSSNIGEEEL